MLETTGRTLAWCIVALSAILLITGSAAGVEGATNFDYEVHLEKTHAQAGPQESVEFPIVVENHGDEPIQVTFERAPEDGPSPGFQVTNPPPVALAAPPGDEPTTVQTVLTVYTPFHNGYVEEEAEITLNVHARHAENESLEGQSKTFTVTAAAEGFHVPGPGTVALLTTLGGIGWIARRHRPRDGA